MIILSLDTARLCGWALSKDGHVTSGTWELKKYTRASKVGEQWLNFLRFLNELTGQFRVDVVVYEDIQSHHSRKRGDSKLNMYAAHSYGGYKALIELWALQNDVQVYPIGVTKNKMIASGYGRADKAAMIQAAELLFPDQKIVDDNQADALCLLASYFELTREKNICEYKYGGVITDEPTIDLKKYWAELNERVIESGVERKTIKRPKGL